MPVYTYHCDECGHEFEKYQSFSEDALTVCPNCEQETLRKVYSPALVVFKGSGFYVTDTKSHSPTLTPTNHKDQENGDSKPESEPKSGEKKAEKKSKKEN
jgi:putative FmdB family regulatory protein